MQEIRFYKDMNHNYLILKDGINNDQKNYQDKMITGNKIRYLLECKIRYVDGERFFYYEISSKQSIRTMYLKKEIQYESLYHIFEQIKEVFLELEKYLLDSRCLILDPDYIYGDPETGEFYFLYYPQSESGQETGLVSMAEFLVERIDHGEEETVSAAYHIYERIMDGTFILSDMRKIFDENRIQKKETERVNHGNTGAFREESEWIPSGKEAAQSIHIKCSEEDRSTFERSKGSESVYEGRETPYHENEKLSKEYTSYTAEEDFFLPDQEASYEMDHTDHGQRRYIWITGWISLLCMGGAAAMILVGYYYSLEGREKILAISGVVFLILLSLFLFSYFLIQMIKYRSRNKKKEDDLMGNDSIETDGHEDYFLGYSDRIQDTESSRESFGNTVFMEAAVKKKENKLYGINKGNKYHISLEHLPCTIGKMAGSVDIVIKDNTISRIHAKLAEQEDGIYVTDLNSTNGTFKNGVRLDPHESVLIEEGDELRFGRMSFCYR